MASQDQYLEMMGLGGNAKVPGLLESWQRLACGRQE